MTGKERRLRRDNGAMGQLQILGCTASIIDLEIQYSCDRLLIDLVASCFSASQPKTLKLQVLSDGRTGW